MTGFEEVKKLKELHAQDKTWTHNFTDLFFGGGIDLLLDIAGQIRPGDDKLLAQLVYEQEDLVRFMTGFGGVRQSERVMIDLLKRYQKMAERMHEASCSGLNRP